MVPNLCVETIHSPVPPSRYNASPKIGITWFIFVEDGLCTCNLTEIPSKFPSKNTDDRGPILVDIAISNESPSFIIGHILHVSQRNPTGSMARVFIESFDLCFRPIGFLSHRKRTDSCEHLSATLRNGLWLDEVS